MSTTPVFNDRVWMLEQKALAQQQEYAINEQERYALMGEGLAIFCQSFLGTMQEGESPLFTREETMQLLLAAIEMR